MKRRVAILGGGQAALTAALQLTDPRNPAAAETAVTIYQLGWRLGGKGATGRPPAGPARILEHGLHNWFGFYDNSFSQIRGVYAELDRPPGAPLATFEAAFEPANKAIFVEWIEGKPLLWEVINPDNDATPGEGGLWLTPLEYVAMALEALDGALAGSPLAGHGQADDGLLARAHALLRSFAHPEPASAHSARHLLQQAAKIARRAAAGAEDAIAGQFDRLKDELARDLPGGAAWIHAIADEALRGLCTVLALFITVLWRAVADGIATAARTAERRLWIEANLAYACIVGAIRDGVIDGGFDVINELDLRAWLTRHAHPDGGVLVASPVVEAVYSGSFAYPRGDTTGGLDYAPAESLEAGVALRGIVRSLFTYKGSFAYRFTAGTADTCYAPTYEVLRRRGVDVRFFSRVDRLELVDGAVARVHVAEQAETVGVDPYQPLIDVDGLPCWPLEPRWEQLVDGEALRGEDFEWPSAELRAAERPRVLELGRDFDDVVLGISIAALPPICGELIAASPAWATAVAKVETVRTQALQVWLTETPDALGFAVAGRPICGWRYGGDSPLNVWGEFTELIAMEHWPADGTPRSLGYFCGTMPDYPDDQFADQAAANARVRANALELLRKGLPILLPKVLDAAGEFRWELLADASGRTGSDRLDAQWIRGNVLATERYVLSVAGSSRHRLPAHDPAGPSNLYLAGDWTQCTINAGCMEAATISGMLCANALCGYPPRAAISGVDF